MQLAFVSQVLGCVSDMWVGVFAHLQTGQTSFGFRLLWTCVGVAYLEVPLDQGYLKTPCSELLLARSGGGLWHAACIRHQGQGLVVCQVCLIFAHLQTGLRF